MSLEKLNVSSVQIACAYELAAWAVLHSYLEALHWDQQQARAVWSTVTQGLIHPGLKCWIPGTAAQNPPRESLTFPSEHLRNKEALYWALVHELLSVNVCTPCSFYKQIPATEQKLKIQSGVSLGLIQAHLSSCVRAAGVHCRATATLNCTHVWSLLGTVVRRAG